MYNNGQAKNFDNGGALFPTEQKRKQNSPDFKGNIKINREMLDYLIDQMENGQDLVLTLFGYNRQGNKGRFIGLSPAIPMAQDERPARQVNSNYGGEVRSYQRPQQNQYNSYRQQSGGGYGQGNQGGRTDFRQQRPSPQQRQANEQAAMEDFQRGDRMPDFGSGDREGKLPWED
jgi:hypothetical protein